jgi:hypothetical protein
LLRSEGAKNGYPSRRVDKGPRSRVFDPAIASATSRQRNALWRKENIRIGILALVFKRAKKFLGIRSVRSGFGDGGEWLWRLERRPASPVSQPLVQPLARSVSIEDTYAEGLDPEEVPADVRARRIPSSWIDGVARLDHHPPFTDIPPHRWRQFLSDCNNFLTAGENWAARAAELGWNAATLFGCRRARPLAHPGGAGLLWAINGGRLVERLRLWMP